MTIKFNSKETIEYTYSKYEYSRDDVTTNPDDGSQTTDTEASSGVPTWTWGVIGVVVVAAFQIIRLTQQSRNRAFMCEFCNSVCRN